MDKIDLDAIIHEFGDGRPGTNFHLKNCMKEAIHQALTLASEQAQIQRTRASARKDPSSGMFIDPLELVVDKQSILDIKNLIV